MDVKDLQYFKVVCQRKSITQAAHSLYLTPQGLSKIIKNIEVELGSKLLVRTGAGVQLTESGRFLYEHLGDFLESYQFICSEIRCIEQSQSHEIDLLSAYGILRLVTPECIAQFREQYPDIQVDYREYPDYEVQRRFLEGNGNVAFTVGDCDKKYLNATFMERFEIKLLVNRQHPLSNKEAVTIEDLRGELLYIESSEFQIHHLITKKCREAGFEPRIAFETSGFSLCYKMVGKNKGISVTPDFIFEDMTNENLVAIPFSDGDYYWETYMLTRDGKKENPDIQLFHRHVMKWLAKVQREPWLRQ